MLGPDDLRERAAALRGLLELVCRGAQTPLRPHC